MTKHRCRVARTFDLKNKTLDCFLSVGPFQRAHWARARALQCAAHPARTCKECERSVVCVYMRGACSSAGAGGGLAGGCILAALTDRGRVAGADGRPTATVALA